MCAQIQENWLGRSGSKFDYKILFVFDIIERILVNTLTYQYLASLNDYSIFLILIPRINEIIYCHRK